jgi:hypothetical protein
MLPNKNRKFWFLRNMEDSEVKAKIVRAMAVSTMDAAVLLRRIHAEFPLPGSGMPDTFEGTHSLTLKDGKLVANIWAEGRHWVAANDA